jgi:hypothetical protein
VAMHPRANTECHPNRVADVAEEHDESMDRAHETEEGAMPTMISRATIPVPGGDSSAGPGFDRILVPRGVGHIFEAEPRRRPRAN